MMNTWQLRVAAGLLLIALVMALLGACPPAQTHKPWVLGIHGNHGFNDSFGNQPSLARCQWMGHAILSSGWPGVIRYSCHKVVDR